jgi:hypothetical protein
MRIGGFKAWKAWAHDGWIGWVAFLLLMVGFVWLAATAPTQNAVRLIGFVYEIVGIAVVFIEIAKASGKNQVTPLHRRMTSYLRRLPLLPQKTNTVIAAGTATLSLTGGRARLSVGLSPTATPDQRIAFLERQVKALDDRIDAMDLRLEAEEKARADAMVTERSARVSAVADLNKRIRDVEVGGLDLSLFGVFFLFVGVILTTATPEICWLLSCR